MGDRGSTVEARSHVAWLFKVSHRCADRAWAGPRLVQLAAWKLTAVAQPLQGPVASARSCVPLRMRAITTGISQLYSRSFLGPPSADASVGCSWLRRRIRDALHFLACPGWPSLIRRPEAPCTPEKGPNRPCTSSLARISDTAQSVRASGTSNCRYQHPPAPWQTSSGKKRTPLETQSSPLVS